MTATQKSHQACVQFSDPAAPEGVQVSTATFLKQCRESALDRFHGPRGRSAGCQTIQHDVPPKPGDEGSTGKIVAHVSPEACTAWESGLPANLRKGHDHIEAQIHLALGDLADQDMHGYLAFSKAQCAIYGPDLVQLIDEALERTTFSGLGRKAECNWEGTLVGRVTPPYLILVISIGLAAPSDGPSEAPTSTTAQGPTKAAGTPPTTR